VYGIVKQTNGSIWVESEPGAGTTFEILFPSAMAVAEAEPPVPSPSGLRGGSETVLLVEDESVIRSLVRNVLSSHGYAVLEAENGEKALGIFRSRKADIDMIIADVVLPGTGGRDIVEGMLTDRPGMSALFMSGYTRDVIDNHGVLTSGLAFLQKPFTPETLLRTVREVLDGRREH
jgi:DNA-binding response OmpR family regulator